MTNPGYIFVDVFGLDGVQVYGSAELDDQDFAGKTFAYPGPGEGYDGEPKFWTEDELREFYAGDDRFMVCGSRDEARRIACRYAEKQAARLDCDWGDNS